MSELLAIKNEINSRFDCLTLSLKLAQQQMGMKKDAIDFELTEQSDARRRLLTVEKQAIQDKELNRRSHTSFVESIRKKLHDEVVARIEAQLTEPKKLLEHVLTFDPKLAELLDALSVKASSISKLEPTAADMPWLCDKLIKLINTPQYRKVDANGKVITVENLKTALSYLGIDNLKMIIPAIAFKHCLPQITDPFPEIKVHILEAAIGTAMAAKTLAQVNGSKKYNAFLLGLFHDLGKVVIVRLFFKIFDQVHREALAAAQNERKPDEHLALSKVTPSEVYLLNAIASYSAPLSATIFQLLPFKHLVFSQAISEYADDKAVTSMSPLGKVLTQAIAYNRYRTLKLNNMIALDEAKDYLRQFYFPKGAISELKNCNLRDFDIIWDKK